MPEPALFVLRGVYATFSVLVAAVIKVACEYADRFVLGAITTNLIKIFRILRRKLVLILIGCLHCVSNMQEFVD